MSEKPYNPLERRNLGASVAEALLERTPRPLGALTPFEGAGIYALYYTGNFPSYAPIAAANRDNRWRWPIYVGKAVPSGARKAMAKAKRDTSLYGRLQERGCNQLDGRDVRTI